MITIIKNLLNQLKLSVNSFKAQEGQATLKFYSPSRGIINIEVSLVSVGSGFFTCDVSAENSALLVDNTYTYELIQGEETLKYGKVRLTNADFELLDYTLDFTLA